jgi:hypothetical protein
MSQEYLDIRSNRFKDNKETIFEGKIIHTAEAVAVAVLDMSMLIVLVAIAPISMVVLPISILISKWALLYFEGVRGSSGTTQFSQLNVRFKARESKGICL